MGRLDEPREVVIACSQVRSAIQDLINSLAGDLAGNGDRGLVLLRGRAVFTSVVELLRVSSDYAQRAEDLARAVRTKKERDATRV